MALADTLSRAHLTEYERPATEVDVERIHATHFLPVPEHQLKELQEETACDQTLQTHESNCGWVSWHEAGTASSHPPLLPTPWQAFDTWWHHIQGTAMCHTSDIKTKDQGEATRDTYWRARLPKKGARKNLLARHECRNYWLHPEVWHLHGLPEQSTQRTTNLPWSPFLDRGKK